MRGTEEKVYQKTTLANGLRVITGPRPHTPSICIIIFIGAGSRYEPDDKAGVSHYIEHLCFKGTRRRPTPRAISETIESVGGILNGATDREMTIYWCKVARPYFSLALDLLVDMLRNSLFDPLEMEKERKVILDELVRTWDSPQDRVELLLDEVVWPSQPLGRDVAGSKETINALSLAALQDSWARQYGPTNAVVSIAGNIEHEEVVTAVGQALGDWAPNNPATLYPAQDSQQTPRLGVEVRKTEQTYFCLGVPGLSYLHPDRFNLDLLNVILGEGMSSRLFLELREKRGLAYEIHSYLTHFTDAGSLTVYAGVDPGHAYEALGAVLEELRRLREEKVSGQELTKAKEFTKGRLLLRMEDTRSVAGWAGSQELLTQRLLTVDDVVAQVDAVVPEDIQRMARQLFVTPKLNLAVVGPIRSQSRLLKSLKI